MTATVAVRERPILFSGPMVRAILDGKKTQTRRVLQVRKRDLRPITLQHGTTWLTQHLAPEGLGTLIPSPYGYAGGRLWVRETFCLAEAVLDNGHRAPVYRAGWFGGTPDAGIVKWSPSIFMPRWASRITLEIADVRVERLQDISYADVIAEGCPSDSPGASPQDHEWYRGLWDSLNAKRGHGWDVNPFVWVISFKRIAS